MFHEVLELTIDKNITNISSRNEKSYKLLSY